MLIACMNDFVASSIHSFSLVCLLLYFPDYLCSFFLRNIKSVHYNHEIYLKYLSFLENTNRQKVVKFHIRNRIDCNIKEHSSTITQKKIMIFFLFRLVYIELLAEAKGVSCMHTFMLYYIIMKVWRSSICSIYTIFQIMMRG